QHRTAAHRGRDRLRPEWSLPRFPAAGQTQPQELNMTEPGNKEQHGEGSQTADEGAEDERINDPLTRTDVKAPRVPFGSQPSPEES
ncbi:MAG: hypothetical protein ACRDRB_13700, partial [Pseudonocardiaceae bacterium]